MDIDAYAADLYRKEAEMAEAYPHLPVLTRVVMAQDELSAERATGMVKAGADPTKVVNTVGSYSRWQWALANCPAAWVAANIAELWRGSDPDDSSSLALLTWQAAYRANGRQPILDGPPLPTAKGGWLDVYRGQLPEDPRGCAWTLDQRVADAFAQGAAYRCPMPGVLLAAKVRPADVLAYITGRKEAEVIVDPANVRGIVVLATYRLVPRAKVTTRRVPAAKVG
jgi:hypothetical protein